MRVLPPPPKSASDMPDFRLSMIAAIGPYYAKYDVNTDVLEYVFRCAPLWWVDETSTDIVRQMAIGVPLDSCCDETTFPPVGMVAFAATLASEELVRRDQKGRLVVDERVLVWHRFDDSESGLVGWEINVYGLVAGATSQGLVPMATASWVDEAGRMPESGHDTNVCSQLVAIMALAKEPRLATTTDEEPDRASRRRAKRAGIDLGATRVIYARPSSGGHNGSGEGHAYKHRWIVSGHWRSQPYGEGMKLRRPVYIAPHVKGPDGAPLLHGEKVRAIVGER